MRNCKPYCQSPVLSILGRSAPVLVRAVAAGVNQSVCRPRASQALLMPNPPPHSAARPWAPQHLSCEGFWKPEHGGLLIFHKHFAPLDFICYGVYTDLSAHRSAFEPFPLLLLYLNPTFVHASLFFRSGKVLLERSVCAAGQRSDRGHSM